MVCSQRWGDEEVIGCSGTPQSGYDYCVYKVPGVLIGRGDNGSPSANFPLGECEGDCDNDNQCAVSPDEIEG